jgi:hypothetical protein
MKVIGYENFDFPDTKTGKQVNIIKLHCLEEIYVSPEHVGTRGGDKAVTVSFVPSKMPEGYTPAQLVGKLIAVAYGQARYDEVKKKLNQPILSVSVVKA